jgi:hypothetical protein
MTQQHFPEAEQRFQKIMAYVAVWPGIEDSAYPINLRQIAIAQMGQQHWQAAEESLKKSVSLLELQIAKALKSDFEFTRTEHAGNLQATQARNLIYLAIVYARENRVTDALNASDVAYEQATRPHVSSEVLNEVLNLGLQIAKASNDETAIKKWSSRSPSQR